MGGGFCGCVRKPRLQRLNNFFESSLPFVDNMIGDVRCSLVLNELNRPLRVFFFSRLRRNHPDWLFLVRTIFRTYINGHIL